MIPCFGKRTFGHYLTKRAHVAKNFVAQTSAGLGLCLTLRPPLPLLRTYLLTKLPCAGFLRLFNCTSFVLPRSFAVGDVSHPQRKVIITITITFLHFKKVIDNWANLL